MKNPDGYIAYTRSIADTYRHQILKSSITIYDIDSLSDIQLALMIRHELGHAFGLAHSDNPNDLMNSRINGVLPYISECDLQALEALYKGSENNQVICKK